MHVALFLKLAVHRCTMVNESAAIVAINVHVDVQHGLFLLYMYIHVVYMYMYIHVYTAAV